MTPDAHPIVGDGRRWPLRRVRLLRARLHAGACRRTHRRRRLLVGPPASTSPRTAWSGSRRGRCSRRPQSCRGATLVRAIDSRRGGRDVCPRGRRHEDGAARDPAALVLNGGVDLAIWIGGVVAEIDRARRAASTRTTARTRRSRSTAELLGLTGSLLPRTSSRGRARRSRRVPARQRDRERRRGRRRARHVDRGSARSRRCSAPVCGASPSHSSRARVFLPEVEAGLTRRLDVGKANATPTRSDAQLRPRDASSFRHGHQPHGAAGPVPRRLRRHAGRPRAPRALLVRHEPEVHASTFSQPGAPRRLARVARSTASFPGAFEASFCRVGDGDGDRSATPRSRVSRRSSATHG